METGSDSDGQNLNYCKLIINVHRVVRQTMPEGGMITLRDPF